MYVIYERIIIVRFRTVKKLRTFAYGARITRFRFSGGKMTTGEKIRHYRKLHGLYQGELGEKIGVSEGAIRHYETDFRTPKQPQIEAIAEALDISPLALKDFGVENARDLLGLLLQLENEFGIVPAEDGSSLSIDASAEKAPKATQMLKAWAAKRNELESGEITPEEYADWKAKF